MMKIDSVASRPDRVGRHVVRFDDGSTMRLYRQTIEDFTLYAGQELSDAQMEELSEAAGAMSAKMRAVRIVAATNVSRKDLEDRLIRKGESPEQAQAATQWMTDMQLLDDQKTAEIVVQRCIRKGYGLARAKQALYEAKIPKEYWEDAIVDYPDQSDAIRDFLSNRIHLGATEKDIKKAVDALLRRGHSYATIRSILNGMSFDSDMFPEE